MFVYQKRKGNPTHLLDVPTDEALVLDHLCIAGPWLADDEIRSRVEQKAELPGKELSVPRFNSDAHSMTHVHRRTHPSPDSVRPSELVISDKSMETHIKL